MKRIVFNLMLLALSLAAHAQTIEPNLKWGKPTNEELQMTEYIADKDADAVILCQQTDVKYDFVNGNFKVLYYINTRLKVLKPEGKRVADQSVVYTEPESNGSRKETLLGLKATAYNMENGKLVKTKMERQMINKERLDKNQVVTKFSVPQVKEGTVIEYEYRIESDYYGDIRSWYAQSDIPVVYTSYRLAIPDWFEFHLDQTGISHLENNVSDDNLVLVLGSDTENLAVKVHTFIGRDLPALKDDDFVWNASDYGCKVTAELAGIYVPGSIHETYTATWKDIDTQLMEDEEFGGRLKKSSALKNEIIAAGIPNIADKKERIAAVWRLLQSKVRWNGDFAFWGKSASKVLKEGTGTNADINFLLINMLHDAGIESTPIVMRTRNRGKLPLSHASYKYLNTFVIGIEMDDDKLAYLDASSIDGYLNVLPSLLLVDRARAVKKNASGFWVNLQESARSRINTTIEATLNADGLLKGELVSMRDDEAAASLRRAWRETKDSVELIQKLQERNNIEIQSYTTEGLHEFSPAATEKMTFTKQCDAAGDMIYLNPLVIIPEKESPFTASERILPIEFPYKQLEVQNISITLPEGYVVEETPQPIIIKFDGAVLRISWSVSENVISVQYQLNINKTFFAPEVYQNLKMFYDKVVENCKNILTIKKVS